MKPKTPTTAPPNAAAAAANAAVTSNTPTCAGPTENRDLIAFLKRYTPKEKHGFIDDFFAMVNPDAPEIHCIDLEKAAKWLQVKKFHLMRSLKRKHALKLDYTVSKPPPVSGRGRNNRRLVLLTPACFKALCLQSQSAQGDRVRDYFVAIESVLFRYRADTMAALRRRVDQLEANQRAKQPQPPKRGGIIYVLRASEEAPNLRKLGKTVNWQKRLASHESARADGLQLEYWTPVDDVDLVESCAKAALKPNKYRKYKEVYQAHMDVITEAVLACKAVGVKMRRVRRRRAPAAPAAAAAAAAAVGGGAAAAPQGLPGGAGASGGPSTRALLVLSRNA